MGGPRRARSSLPRTSGRSWLYYGALAGLGVGLSGLLARSPAMTIGGGLLWLALTTSFCRRRLRGTSRRPAHLLEIAVTSALIPPLACFWRLAGAVRHRVVFF